MDPDDAVVTPLHPTWETTRYRAIAAVSGVAAAALVVAGVASGGGHTGRPTVTAQGTRVSARAQQGGGVPGEPSQAPPVASATAPVATTVALSGTTGGVPFTESGGSTAVGRIHGLPVAASPAPRGGSPSSGGSGGGTVRPRRPRRQHPLIRCTGPGECRHTVSGLGTTMTNTVTQIGKRRAARGPGHGIVGKWRNGPEQPGHVLRSPGADGSGLAAAELVRRNRQESWISAAQTTVRFNCPLIVET